MIAIIVIAFLALMGAALRLILKQRQPSNITDNRVLESPHFAGLFEQPDAPQIKDPGGSTTSQLIERAREGDLNTLAEAHSLHDAQVYADVVNALSEWTSLRQERLEGLVSHISKSNELRATNQLARRLIETFRADPDRRSTTAMIHIAALSDDAGTYEQAVETALDVWRSGRLAAVSSEELADLVISQYWLLAPGARRGGVGFALKRRLLGIRRELATVSPVR